MTRTIAVVVCLVPALAVGAEPKDKKHELSFRKDGDALIASTTIRIDDGKHLLLATFDNTEALAPGLQYTVIQNSDELTTKKKDLTIEWRITGERAKVNPWRVHGQVIKLSTAELKLLGGKALELVP
jgi:hypothetical protein